MKLAFLHGFLLFSLTFSVGAGAADHPAVALCKEIYAENDAQETFARAYELYPYDPIRRAIYLEQQHGQVAVPFQFNAAAEPKVVGFKGRSETTNPLDSLVAVNASGPRPDVRAVVDLDLDSVRYMSPADYRGVSKEPLVVPGDPPLRFKNAVFHPRKGAEIIVDVTHGWSAVFSNTARVFPQMSVLNATKADGRLYQSIGANVTSVCAVGIDRPFHGPSTSSPELFSLPESLNWRVKYYDTLRSHGLPVVPMTRSGENILVAQLAFERPDLFKGMIWTNPMHMKEGLIQALEGTKQVYREDRSPVNGTSLRWVTKIFEDLFALPAKDQWWEAPSGMPDVPVLIIVGQHDAEVSPATRAHYRELAKKNPKVFYVEVPGASHDVFSVTEDAKGTGQSGQRHSEAAEARAVGSWQYVYWFLQSQILKNETAPKPTLGWMIE